MAASTASRADFFVMGPGGRAHTREMLRASSIVAALSFCACGGRVVVDVPLRSGGGAAASSDATTSAGGALTIASSSTDVAASSTSTSETTSAGSGLWPDCTAACAGTGTTTCSCSFDCTKSTTVFTPKKFDIECMPAEGDQSAGSLTCTCVIEGLFSGDCFDEPATACDAKLGCCANYFFGK